MKKVVIAALPLLAVIAAVTGVLVVKASGGGGSGDSALAAAQAQEEQAPWLGIQVVRTPDGLTVSFVIADSPADKAGLKRNDVITAVDGNAVSDMEALLNALEGKQPGDTVALSIARDGNAQDVTVTLEARPQPLPRDNPIFPELNGIARDEMFSHMLGGSFDFTDQDGNEHTATVDPGTVTAVDATAKTISVDLNSGGQQTYTISEGVLTFPDDLAQFQADDRVSIISVDGELRAISKGPGGMLPFFGKGGGHHGGMRGFDGRGFNMPGRHGFGAPDGGSGLGVPGFGGGSAIGSAGGM